jgi:uncharacterized membrane protein (UPF0127 family)
MDTSGFRLVVGAESIPLAIAETRAARRQGLLGTSRVEGALLLRRTSSVHTFGMRFPIDVAHLDAELRVLRTTTMAPNRLGWPVRGARNVLEATAGAFARWGLGPGAVVEVRSVTPEGSDGRVR